MKTEKQKIGIVDGKSFDIPRMYPSKFPPATMENEYPCFGPTFESLPSQAAQRGICESFHAVGNKLLHGISFRDSLSGYGYATVEGSQVRIELQTVESVDGPRVIGIVQAPAIMFPAPIPLETVDDATEWRRRGWNGAQTVEAWRKRLKWKGYGSKQAAGFMYERYCAIGKGISFKPIPNVVFPARETPVESAPVESAPVDTDQGRLEAMEKRLAEMMEKRLAEMMEKILATFVP